MAEVADRIDSAAAKALAEPEAMKVSSPDSARARPPDIGASSSSWPDLARRSPSDLAKAAGTVAHCMTRPPLRSLATRAALAEQHRLDLLGVDHGHDQRIGRGGGFAGRGRDRAARRGEGLARRRAGIDADHLVAVLEQVLRHAEAHRAQADEGDDGSVLVRHGSYALMPYFAAQPRPAPVVVLGLYSRPT